MGDEGVAESVGDHVMAASFSSVSIFLLGVSKTNFFFATFDGGGVMSIWPEMSIWPIIGLRTNFLTHFSSKDPLKSLVEDLVFLAREVGGWGFLTSGKDL